MSDLRSLFDTIVDNPLAPPPPLTELTERIRHRRGRLAASGLGVGLAVLGLGAAVVAALDDPAPVQLRVTGDGPSTAAYTARVPAGYRADGVWTITIERNGREIQLSSGGSPPCADSSAIQPGDVVTATIGDRRSLVKVGPEQGCR